MKFLYIISAAFIALFSTGCKKFVDVDPPANQLTAVQVFADDLTAESAVAGIYSRMRSDGFSSGGSFSVTVLSGLSSDELADFSNNMEPRAFFENQLTPTNSVMAVHLWGGPYQYIYSCNAILEGLAKSPQVTPGKRSQLIGEVKFLRAFCYFYLVSLFGDVPIHLTTDYRANTVSSRSSIDAVYNVILNDLSEAESLLTDGYKNNERVRANKSAAQALLARTYLFKSDWVKAEQYATAVISNSLYSLLPDLDQVFLKNSSEAIWQLKPSSGNNTPEGSLFILNGPPDKVALTSSLLNSFETNDLRLQKWINSISTATGNFSYANKYKEHQPTATTIEYSMVLRLAEQYLIRAEARAMQNKLTGTGSAQSDINAIRNRAGLTNTSAATTQQLLDAIVTERQHELFTEWGHRWIDLKRTGKVNAILQAIKGGNWQATDVLYPIPQDEISRNSNVTQNPGY